jgi:hypothetical protein
MSTTTLFDDYVNAFFVLLDDWQCAAGRLQQSREFGFDKAALLLRIAHMTERWAHVERAASLTLEQHIVAAQMNLGQFTGSLQLF